MPTTGLVFGPYRVRACTSAQTKKRVGCHVSGSRSCGLRMLCHENARSHLVGCLFPPETSCRVAGTCWASGVRRSSPMSNIIMILRTEERVQPGNFVPTASWLFTGCMVGARPLFAQGHLPFPGCCPYKSTTARQVRDHVC